MTIDLDTAQLRAAGREARAVADRVDAARQASGAALPGNAFGLMCSPLLLPAYRLASHFSAMRRIEASLVGSTATAATSRHASACDSALTTKRSSAPAHTT